MGGVLGHILGGDIRREMKERVDEVLAAGERWDKTAKELIEATDKLTKAIECDKGSRGATGVAKATRRLSRETGVLADAFKSLDGTLQSMITRYGT
jgi:hypothetical protein